MALMNIVINPRSINAKHTEYGVYDALLSNDGRLRMFDTLDDAKQYVRDNNIEATQPNYFIAQIAGW